MSSKCQQSQLGELRVARIAICVFALDRKPSFHDEVVADA
jgi:hypothetical protein